MSSNSDSDNNPRTSLRIKPAIYKLTDGRGYTSRTYIGPKKILGKIYLHLVINRDSTDLTMVPVVVDPETIVPEYN